MCFRWPQKENSPSQTLRIGLERTPKWYSPIKAVHPSILPASHLLHLMDLQIAGRSARFHCMRLERASKTWKKGTRLGKVRKLGPQT